MMGFIGDVFQYFVNHPILLLSVLYLVKRFFDSQQPFPSVDYGHVSTIDSKTDFDNCVAQRRISKSKDALKPTITIVDFYATWCPPCKAAVPVYARMSEDFYAQGVQFFKVDVDKNRDISGSEGITAMPTFKIYKAGQCIETVRGFNSSAIRAALDKHAG